MEHGNNYINVFIYHYIITKIYVNKHAYIMNRISVVFMNKKKISQNSPTIHIQFFYKLQHDEPCRIAPTFFVRAERKLPLVEYYVTTLDNMPSVDVETAICLA